MTSLENPAVDCNPEVLRCARLALSGKRIALLGFTSGSAAELTNRIAAAEGFTRALSPAQVPPSSESLRPFDLILLDVEAATDTAWLRPEELVNVADRCVAAGSYPVLMRLAVETTLTFRESWDTSGPPDEILLRCVLALRATPHGSKQVIPAGSTVVLADDDSSITAMVRRALERNGLSCEVAANGRDALSMITRLKPCAAVLDVHMPAIDGFEVLSRIKSATNLSATRVILLTGSEQEADVIRGFSLGADDYICKPFNPMELTIRLMRVLGRL
jgi:CheY-like chemotaxis protein